MGNCRSFDRQLFTKKAEQYANKKDIRRIYPLGGSELDMEIALAGILAGIFSSMGMGGGGVLIIYFSLFTALPQLQAQGINVLFFIPVATVSVVIYNFKGMIDWKAALPFAIFGFISSYFGVQLASVIEESVLRKIFAALLIIMGVRELFSGVHFKK